MWIKIINLTHTALSIKNKTTRLTDLNKKNAISTIPIQYLIMKIIVFYTDT